MVFSYKIPEVVLLQKTRNSSFTENQKGILIEIKLFLDRGPEDFFLEDQRVSFLKMKGLLAEGPEGLSI